MTNSSLYYGFHPCNRLILIGLVFGFQSLAAQLVWYDYHNVFEVVDVSIGDPVVNIEEGEVTGSITCSDPDEVGEIVNFPLRFGIDLNNGIILIDDGEILIEGTLDPETGTFEAEITEGPAPVPGNEEFHTTTIQSFLGTFSSSFASVSGQYQDKSITGWSRDERTVECTTVFNFDGVAKIQMRWPEGETIPDSDFQINGVWKTTDGDGFLDLSGVPEERNPEFSTDLVRQTINEEEFSRPINQVNVSKALVDGFVIVCLAPRLHVLSIGLDYDDKDPSDTLKSAYMASQFSNSISQNEVFTNVVNNVVLRLSPLYDKGISLDLINLEFSKISNDLQDEDVFILFMSGHGASDNGNSEAEVQQQIDPTNLDFRFENTGDEGLVLENEFSLFTDDELVEVFEMSSAWESVDKLLILDMCYAGGYWPDVKNLPRVAMYAAAKEPDFSVATIDLIASAKFAKIVYTGIFARSVVSAFEDLESFKSVRDLENLKPDIRNNATQFAGQLGRVMLAPYYVSSEPVAVVDGKMVFRKTMDFSPDSLQTLSVYPDPRGLGTLLDWDIDLKLESSKNLVDWDSLLPIEPPLLLDLSDEAVFYRISDE